MASNYLFLTGWEMGAASICDNVVSSAPVTTAQKRTGVYSLDCSNHSDGVSVNLGAEYTTIYAGVAYRPNESGGSAGNNIIGAANSDGEMQWSISLVNGSTALAAYLVTGSSNLVALGTGSNLTLNQWHYIEVKVKQANDASGELEVYLDGVLDITYNGDTFGYYSPMNMRHIAVGDHNFAGYPWYGAGGYYDDFMIATDGHVGRCGIELLKPTGAGASTDLTPSAGNNYACVDEVPPTDDTDYVSGSSVDDHDTYALGDLTLSGTVKAVQGFARAKLSEAGEGSIAPVLRSGGTDYTGSDSGLDVDYVYKHWIYNTDPKTGVAWVSTNVNALEFGPKVR